MYVCMYFLMAATLLCKAVRIYIYIYIHTNGAYTQEWLTHTHKYTHTHDLHALPYHDHDHALSISLLWLIFVFFGFLKSVKPVISSDYLHTWIGGINGLTRSCPRKGCHLDDVWLSYSHSEKIIFITQCKQCAIIDDSFLIYCSQKKCHVCVM